MSFTFWGILKAIKKMTSLRHYHNGSKTCDREKQGKTCTNYYRREVHIVLMRARTKEAVISVRKTRLTTTAASSVSSFEDQTDVVANERVVPGKGLRLPSSPLI